MHVFNHTPDSLSSFHALSYALGSLDPATITSFTLSSFGTPAFVLLVPGPDDLPPSLLTDRPFWDGAMVGYETCNWDDEIENGPFGVPAALANWVHHSLVWEISHGGNSAWAVGYVLGALSSLAETDMPLALVGISSLVFLLRFLLPLPPGAARQRAILGAMSAYDRMLTVYQKRVWDLKAQGLDLLTASRLALAGWQRVEESKLAPLDARRQGNDAQPTTPGAREEVA